MAFTFDMKLLTESKQHLNNDNELWLSQWSSRGKLDVHNGTYLCKDNVLAASVTERYHTSFGI